jgi:NAD(P)-dependent dehydrogenase (short-subunit alcohol dehydrogenase family)
MDLGLAGKTAVVTGGSSGIGLATVRLLISEGMNVATCARGGDRLKAAVETMDVPSDQALIAEEADVLNGHRMSEFVGSVAERTGSVDVLINNAGRARVSRFDDTDDAAWRDELELKFFSVINPTQASLPYLREARGSIVIVNALLARQPEPHMVATSAARAGVLNLSRSLASEFAPDVRVNSVLVGLIRTEQWRERYRRSESELTESEWLREIAGRRGIPMGRLADPEEVASAMAFLASPRASYVTGAALEISGGVGRSI